MLSKRLKIDDTDRIGFQAKSHSVDSSGDCIIAIDRRQSDQLASYRFNNDANAVEDTTKQELVTPALHTPSNASIDTSIQKFGTGSLKLSGICPVKFPAFNLTTKEWSARAWMSVATAHHATW